MSVRRLYDLTWLCSWDLYYFFVVACCPLPLLLPSPRLWNVCISSMLYSIFTSMICGVCQKLMFCLVCTCRMVLQAQVMQQTSALPYITNIYLQDGAYATSTWYKIHQSYLWHIRCVTHAKSTRWIKHKMQVIRCRKHTIPQAHDAENNAANRCCNKSILEQSVQRHATQHTCKSTNRFICCMLGTKRRTGEFVSNHIIPITDAFHV